MFVTIYIPIFDMRDLFPIRSSKTQRPTWPVPLLSPHAFQRNLGPIKTRPLGGVRGWVAESAICEIKSSLRIEDACWPRSQTQIKPAFKRLYADGDGGVQFSIGVELPLASSADHKQIAQMVSALLAKKIKCRQRSYDVSLRDAGGLVADLFASGSVKGNQRWGHNAYLPHAKPLIVLEGKDVGRYSTSANSSHADDITGEQFSIEEISRSLALGSDVPVFAFCNRTRKSRSLLRSMRIITARLYLELFCFERLIDLMMSPRLKDVDGQGLSAIRARLGLCSQRLTGSASLRAAEKWDIYDILTGSFSELHRPGYMYELQNVLKRLDASENLQRATLVTASKTGILTDSSRAINGAISVTQYINHGQVGAMGDNAQASNFDQKWASVGPSIDLPELSKQLLRLQKEMGAIADSSSELESMTSIVKAREAASSNDGPAVFKHLANAGKWALGVAEKVGVDLATVAIKTSLGLS